MNGFANLLLKAGPTRLFAALGVTAVIAALMFTLIFRMGNEDKALLFSDVDMREAGQITSRLDQAQIPYELRGDGSSIFVARSKVLEARMMLSADGLPSRGSVGYEIFDQPEALGQTEFQQNINRLRALEGELARTIGSLDGVASARVHLVLPERQMFSHDTEKPTASIVLKLRRDALTDGQVRAIRNLVASATPGLTANRVTILDETGRLLAAASDEDGVDLTGDGIDSREASMEERIRHTVTDIVEGVVGAGNARVQVSADMDFSRTSETSEHYDPDGKVVRSTSTSEGAATRSQGGAAQGATAGANVPDGAGGSGGHNNQSDNNSTSQETVNYEISRTTTTRVNNGGDIKRLSVAVAVDGVTAPGANGHPGQYTARSAEEMQRITALVRSAVGYNEQRGDHVEVVNVQFTRPPVITDAAAKPGFFDNMDMNRIIEIAAALIASLAFVFFVLGPLVSGLVRGGGGSGGGSNIGGNLNVPAGLPNAPYAAALPAPDGMQMDTGGGEASIDIAQIQGRVRASSVKKVAEVVEKHPDESVQIIRGWLNNAL